MLYLKMNAQNKTKTYSSVLHSHKVRTK